MAQYWSKDSVEHLRTVHFTLTVVCVGLIVLASSPSPTQVEIAHEQLQEIRQMQNVLKPGWADDFVAQRVRTADTKPQEYESPNSVPWVKFGTEETDALQFTYEEKQMDIPMPCRSVGVGRFCENGMLMRQTIRNPLPWKESLTHLIQRPIPPNASSIPKFLGHACQGRFVHLDPQGLGNYWVHWLLLIISLAIVIPVGLLTCRGLWTANSGVAQDTASAETKSSHKAASS